MRSLLTFDDINGLEYSDWFAEMGISDAAVEQRTLTAEMIDKRLLNAFSWYERHNMSITDGYNHFYNAYLDLLDELDIEDEYLENRAINFAKQVERATRTHSGEYWTSADRAAAIARTESNIINNYREYADALGDISGAAEKPRGGLGGNLSPSAGKMYKTWHGMMDARERPTHVEMEGKTIPISEYFVVGPSHSEMLFPTDLSRNPSPDEYLNCRCWCTYK